MNCKGSYNEGSLQMFIDSASDFSGQEAPFARPLTQDPSYLDYSEIILILLFFFF